MALVVFDRVQETTGTTGTGTITLAGAVSGFQSFAVVGNGNTTYYCIINGSDWEVGLGTYSSTGPTLARTTVLSNSLGTTSPITLVGASNVFITYPAEKAVTVDGSGDVTLPGSLNVENGLLFTQDIRGSATIPAGSGNQVTLAAGSGARLSSLTDGIVTIQTGTTGSVDKLFTFDANGNLQLNSVNQDLSVTTATGGTTVLTLADTHFQVLIGTTTHTFQLPDATTEPVGVSYIFDNDSTGNLFVVNAAGAAIDTVPPGGYTTVFLEANGTIAGIWGRFGMLPNEVNWGTNSLNLVSTVVSGGTWQGGTIQPAYGGTGITTFSAANNALYSTGASTLTAGTLPVAAGGTGITTFSAANNALYSTGASTLTAGTLPVAAGGTGVTSATANTVFAGPTTGAAAAPSFRALVAADIPSTYSQFAAGTALLFYQAAAPTGWTQVTTQNNKALRVVSGTGGGTGGSVAFTTAFASQTPAGSVSTSISAISGTVGTSITGVSGSVGISGGSVSATTLTTAQIPAHQHGYSASTGLQSADHAHGWGNQTGGQSANHSHALSGNSVAANQAFLIGSGGQVTYGDTNVVNTTNTVSNDHSHYVSGGTGGVNANHSHAFSGTTDNAGGGTSHTHGFTNPSGSFTFSSGSASSSFTFSSGTASSAFTGSAINLAVQYIDVIVCTKN
jgi:hypothetical protein